MSIKSWKKFLVGAAAAGTFIPSAALAAPTCAYILGHVNSITAATPAVPVVVPDSSFDVQPVTVHVDETNQTILGYSLTVPGANAGTEGTPVFVPGVSQHVPSFVVTLPELNLDNSRCVNVDGVVTPAVPIHIPASVINLPGAVAEVGGILINIVGNPVTVPGQVITFDGHRVVVPEQDTGVPGVPVGTPDASIVVDVNGTVESAQYLAPN